MIVGGKKELKFKPDCKTRWNSLLKMLQRVTEFKDIVVPFLEELDYHDPLPALQIFPQLKRTLIPLQQYKQQCWNWE